MDQIERRERGGRPHMAPSEIRRRFASPPRSNEVDRAFALAVRQRRIMLGTTQAQLAEACGVTYQQQHKREVGINRFSLGAAHATAAALGTTIAELLGEPEEREIDDEARPLLELGRLARRLDRRGMAALVGVARALARQDDEDEENGDE